MSCQDGDAPPASDIKGEPWPDHDMKFSGKIKKEISKAVKMTHFKDGVKFEGEMPLKYCGVISPSDDPVRWFGTKTAVTMEKFCYPDVLVWYPEAQWPTLQPGARLPCRWHGTIECVGNEGWMKRPRHGYLQARTVAVLGRCYKCKEREKEGADEYCFQSVDERVTGQLNDYVKSMWKAAIQKKKVIRHKYHLGIVQSPPSSSFPFFSSPSSFSFPLFSFGSCPLVSTVRTKKLPTLAHFWCAWPILR